MPPQVFRAETWHNVHDGQLVDKARQLMVSYNEDTENKSPQNLGEKLFVVSKLRRDNFQRFLAENTIVQ